MARIRTIKPEFWTSEQVVECSPNARLLFIGMLNFCDDSGIHPANVRRIQMEVYPCGTFNKSDVEVMVNELIKHNLIKCYTVNDCDYWMMTGFQKHQRIDQPTYKYPLQDGHIPSKVRRNKPEDSPNKSNDSSNQSKNSSNDHRANNEHSPDVHPRKGKEGKGKESNNNPQTPKRGLVDERFERFYEAYPVKKAPGAAEKSFKKLNPDDLMLSKMLKAIRLQSEHREKLKAANQFTPDWKHPATWLNQRCWADEIETVTLPQHEVYSSGGQAPSRLKPFNFDAE